MIVKDTYEKSVKSLSKMMVHLYKVFGLVVLCVILLGLGAFFLVNFFYLVDRSWVAPLILSPSHQRVVELRGQLAQQSYHRDKLDAERLSLRADLNDTHRAIALHERFQASFRSALEQERDAASEQAAVYRNLQKAYGRTRHKMARSSKAYSALEDTLLEDHKASQLIDRQTYTRGKHLLAQVQMSNTNVRERHADLGMRAGALDRRAEALQAAIDGGDEGAKAYDVLMMTRERDLSATELAGLKERRTNLDAQLALIDRSIGRYEGLLDDIKGSPWLRAVEGKVTIAFVPYDNLDAAEKGEPIYGCALGLVWCREVGEVVSVIDGEVSAKHPLDNQEVRGLMVEIKLDDASWAREKALFAGQRPLWIF